jgi:beta-aspartyl-dipeptidase (metallo-type)
VTASPSPATFLLIENGDLFAPEPRGVQSILVAGETIVRMGDVDRRALDMLGVEYDTVDARGCVVTPGLVDPHEHLLGGSGEGSLALQTPMLFVDEIARAGVTCVVGTLGVDTTMKTPAGLLARVKALNEEGLTARMWTGGYNVPPTTVMQSVREDMLFIGEVIGAGEIAISDPRGLDPAPRDLARLVRDTHTGGLLSGKAGVTHFHVGEEDTRLAPLCELIEQFRIPASWLYPTHVERSEALMDEAIALAHRGAHVDVDIVERDLARWVRYYFDHGGPPERLTVSSDADSSTPDILSGEVRALARDGDHPLERVLRLASTNAATVLCLDRKGRLDVGMDADILVLEHGSLDIRDVIARGRPVVRDGAVRIRERFIEQSSRRWSLEGAKAPPPS